MPGSVGSVGRVSEVSEFIYILRSTGIRHHDTSRHLATNDRRNAYRQTGEQSISGYRIYIQFLATPVRRREMVYNLSSIRLRLPRQFENVF